MPRRPRILRPAVRCASGCGNALWVQPMTDIAERARAFLSADETEDFIDTAVGLVRDLLAQNEKLLAVVEACRNVNEFDLLPPTVRDALAALPREPTDG